MDEILHHLGALNYCNSWGFRDLRWCKISSINSSGIVGIYEGPNIVTRIPSSHHYRVGGPPNPYPHYTPCDTSGGSCKIPERKCNLAQALPLS